MKTFRFLIFFFILFLVPITFAQTQLHQFMTSRDIFNRDSTANINLQNNRNSVVTVYGLYVRQLSYVSPGDTCNHATSIYSAADNVTAGSFVAPTVINAGKRAAIGSNYLYNMLYQALYYVGIIFPTTPPGCALPGCTWGSDTTLYHWCIYLGALAPVSTSANDTANIVPSTVLASSPSQYDYNLITQYISLGPISCNDQTLTCSAASQQTQSIS